MGRGRGREDLRPFFALLGPEGCARLEAAAIDMNGAYAEELRAHCPHVAIVYDLFHVIAKYGREVVDRVRLDETLRLADRVRLRELLAANRALFTVYVRKDDLKQLWRYHYPAAARRFWAQWRARALASRLAPLRAFVQRLTPCLEGIMNHCRYQIGRAHV